MYTMRQSWTDERLDDFREEVNRRFDKVEGELQRVNDRLDGMHRALIFAAISFTSATFAGYGAMIALILTRT